MYGGCQTLPRSCLLLIGFVFLFFIVLFFMIIFDGGGGGGGGSDTGKRVKNLGRKIVFFLVDCFFCTQQAE